MGWLAALRGWRADLAALALGALAALALPPIHVIPVLLIAFPGLLALIGAALRPVVALRRGWWFGFGLHLVGLYWITEAILIEAARFWWFVPIAVPALAATLACFIAVAAWAAAFARPGWRRVLVLAGAWVLADLARQFVATGFPWNPLGSVWELPGQPGNVLIQPAALVSVHGLTLATVFLASLPVLGRYWRLAGVLLLAAWIGFGLARLSGPGPAPLDLTAVIVQGNVAQGHKWDRAYALDVFRHYLQLTARGMAQAGAGTRAVIWPETASPFLLGEDPVARQAIEAAADEADSLVGAVRFDPAGRPRNSLFALTDHGSIAGVYDKWHLVPFGEYQPDWFPLGIQVVPGGGFARGPGPRTLHVPGLPAVGPLICYEAIFPGQVVDESDRPAWMVNVTNDAWFGNSTGPRQHLAAARLRAVEEGLPLVRAANTGISAVFDALGREHGRLPLNNTGVLNLHVLGPLPPTVFARLGLVFPAGLAVLCVAVGFLGVRHRRTDRRNTMKSETIPIL
jgi:apolipoprotein N-acyltransferase